MCINKKRNKKNMVNFTIYNIYQHINFKYYTLFKKTKSNTACDKNKNI